MRKRHKEKLKRKQRRIKNRVTIRTLFLLIITLIFNTYAWFTYFNTISANMTAHVDKWHVQFKVDDEIVEREFPIAIEHAYPGMPDVEKMVTIINDGEKDADIDYAIKSVRIFDSVFVASDQKGTGDTIPEGATILHSSEIERKIENEYPFSLSLATENNNNTLTAEDEVVLKITFNWLYESGDDEKDTSYGTTAYDFYQANPGKQAIELVVKIIVKQHEETTTPVIP
ncbi:MAG: hypothetical protein IJK18_02125 [Clostridia bacterium]|nr:hypothetical protein [Clostridia bacterium]